MADDPAHERAIPRIIRTHAYTPVCPVHGSPMAPYAWGVRVTYFRCERDERACPYRSKAPVENFIPASSADVSRLAGKKFTGRR